MGDVANCKVGCKPKDIQQTGKYEYINAGTSNSGFTDFSNCAGDTITTPSRGQGGIGFVGYQKRSFWLGPLCYQIRSKTNDVLNKYIYYAMVVNNGQLLYFKKEGGTPAVNLSDLKEVIIPVPSMEEQLRIVSILDKSETLTTDLQLGLPAEIDARRKQYEYYRNKLLSFSRA